MGAIRGWRDAISGSIVAILVLLGLVAARGSALTRIPPRDVQFWFGALLLLFGVRWLRKAIQRAASVLALHDETAIYARQTQTLTGADVHRRGWDKLAFAAAFKITMLEGIEVVFIVIAIGAGRLGLLVPASIGAAAALVLVATPGLLVHRPLAHVPENTLNLVVGALLCAFGVFWVGEGWVTHGPAATGPPPP